ncbi:hypothetical protein GCM10009715_11760 [Paeniglutamicibacter psychrophenolicus]|uniref:Uncharacterized protein n=1 Tax=Paeniglutamicibacter psychrophenolicus TaxID=257454 RepID=A0ABS4W7F6_9MICC|nr:hypothetical protein [Paeniglutamicibacter psychrophenolicus]MBP2372126.1 hypothetical protein [Paeniglutamicibacter psychrophenolicus]
MSKKRESIEADSPSEQTAAEAILGAFQSFQNWEETIEKYQTPARTSRFADDNALNRHFPVNQLAYEQLMVAFGSLQSLEQMIVNEKGATIQIVAHPYGPYALVRNAIDAAAQALWLIEPENSKLRIRRRIEAQLKDIHLSKQFKTEIDEPSKKTERWIKGYTERMKEVAEESGLDTSSFKDWKQPTMTMMLGKLQHWDQIASLTWLAAWQLCSGHAHGKQWATFTSHELTEVPGTADEVGATFHVTLSYKSLAGVILSTQKLIQATCERYSELSMPSDG